MDCTYYSKTHENHFKGYSKISPEIKFEWLRNVNISAMILLTSKSVTRCTEIEKPQIMSKISHTLIGCISSERDQSTKFNNGANSAVIKLC